MAETLQAAIKELQKVSSIHSRPDLSDYLTKIEHYSNDNQEKAYLLGQFFKHKFGSDHLPSDKRKLLLKSIKDSNLEPYFYLKQQPGNEQPNHLFLILSIGGFLVLCVGVIQLINGNFWVGLGTKYLTFVVREGGYKVILGILLLIGGLIRYRYEQHKKRFVSALSSSED